MHVRPLFRISPEFTPAIAMLEALVFGLIGSILITLFIGSIVFIVLSIFGVTFFPHKFLFIGCILLLPPIYYEVKMRTTRRTKYNFFADHIDFEHHIPFRGRNKGILHYDQIRQMAQRSSFLQQRFNLKTIYFYAPVLQVRDRSGFVGIKIRDIPIGYDWGSKIEELLQRQNEENKKNV